MKKFILSLACLGSVLTFQSCQDDDSVKPDITKHKEKVVENYADIVYTSYQDSYKLAKVLQSKIYAFLDNPTENIFEEAKQAWYDSREPYGQTEAYRFAGGPIDFGENQVEGMINAWPLDESFIDYVSHPDNVNGDSNINIINNVTDYPEITPELLREMNEYNGNERSVSLGYHAIEFLLWGQDSQTPVAGAEHTTGGNRPYTDYVDGGTASHQDRRRKYLKIATDLLVEDLEYLVNSWDNDGNNYRSQFVKSMDADKALSRILSGAGVLAGAELAEERILVAVENESQEDEHSCFSDNTHRDIITNYEGVKNVFFGEYTRLDGTKVSGTSIYDLLKEKDAKLANEIINSFKIIENELNATSIPFDYALTQSDDVNRLNKVIQNLREVGDDFVKTANVLGVGTYTVPE